MQILIILLGFILWYFGYDSKPINNDDGTNLWEKENFIKRARLLNILKETF